MKNLFDFATKELSQDAFLRWLFENYNCEDKDVNNVSRDILINFISKQYHNERPEDIVNVWTKAQDHKADIVVCVKMKSGLEYGIIIEDKTLTNEHNDQLQRYYNIFTNDKWWNGKVPNATEKKLIFIYYKTMPIVIKDDEEKKNYEYWHLYDIDAIHNLYPKSSEINNLILKQYISFIEKRYEDLNYVSKENIIEWNFQNYNTFFEKELKERYKDYKMAIWLGEYMGMYVSYLFEIDAPSSNNKIVLEFFFRKNSSKINSTIHPHIIHSDFDAWHASDKYNEEDEQYISNLRGQIRNSNSKFFKSHISKQCVGTSISNTDIEKSINAEEFLKQLDCRIQDFINIFK